MLVVQLALFALSTALSVAFGIRYLACRQYMPYHAVVAGRDWAALDVGLQSVILGMLRIVGGGLLATGVATAWLMVGLYQGLAWAPWALLTLTFASTLALSSSEASSTTITSNGACAPCRASERRQARV